MHALRGNAERDVVGLGHVAERLRDHQLRVVRRRGDVTQPPLGEGAQLTVTSVVAKPDLLRCSSLRASYVVQGFANGAWSTLTSGIAYGALVNPGAPFGSQECVATFTDSIAATQAAQYGAFRMGGSATATGASAWSPPVTVAVRGWAF